MPSRKGWHFYMEEKICAFFGHRTIENAEALYATVTAEVLQSVEEGCRIFYFGGFGEFDALCYEVVSQLMRKYPNAGFQRVYCVALERSLRNERKRLQGAYEDIVYLTPSFTGWYKSIYFRNCAMIDESDKVIFYAEAREDSGAYKAYVYAKKSKGKKVVNLWGA